MKRTLWYCVPGGARNAEFCGRNQANGGNVFFDWRIRRWYFGLYWHGQNFSPSDFWRDRSRKICVFTLTLTISDAPQSARILRFILCDSKLVELNQYSGIPHLLIPIVTDTKRIIRALQWGEYEAYSRLKKFAKFKKNSLQGYNDYLWENFLSETGLPQIVLVVDDISIITAQEPRVIDCIKNIILNGRTTGIHLLLATQNATQRGTRDIAKLIPSKVVFLTLTERDSKYLISNTSACHLEIPGNAIFSSGPGIAINIKTIMAENNTKESILSISRRREPQYEENIILFIEENEDKSDIYSKSFTQTDELDELFAEAVDVVLETCQASVSMLQRRLKLGYSRAAKLVDQMEEKKYIGPFEGSKPRQILITKDDWKTIKNNLPL